MTTDPTAAEERVARHLAARDWLTDEDRWTNATATFRADYLSAAREVIALVQQPATVPVSSPPADRAALRDRIAETLTEAYLTAPDDSAIMDALAAAVLAVLPEPADRAAVLREAIDIAREEGHRLEEVAGIEPARGARCVAYLLRKLLAKEQPELRRLADETLAATECTQCGDTGACNGGLCPLLMAGTNPEPTPLRWGLDDVMHGDDDTTTVLLSGPSGEPYRLELEPERAAALRDSLAGPGEPAVQPGEELASGVQQCGHDDYHDPHEWHDKPHLWCPGHSFADDAQPAQPQTDTTA